MKVAIIGSGGMAKAHADAICQIDGAEIVMFIARNEEKGRKLASEFSALFSTDIEYIANKNIDVVDICLPTYMHLCSIEKASEFCKNIICEKPLTLSIEEIDKLKVLIDEKGINLMVGHLLRFFSGYRKVKEIIDSGRLGKINSVVCKRRGSLPNWAGDGWFFDESKSGGPLFDVACHDLNFITWLFGSPISVYGRLDGEKNGIHLHAKGEFAYEGFSASVFASWGMPKKYAETLGYSSVEVIGDSGMLYYDSTGKFLIIDDEVSVVEYQNKDPFVVELEYFLRCVQNGEVPSVSDFSSSVSTIKILEAMFSSNKQNKIIVM